MIAPTSIYCFVCLPPVTPTCHVVLGSLASPTWLVVFPHGNLVLPRHLSSLGLFLWTLLCSTQFAPQEKIQVMDAYHHVAPFELKLSKQSMLWWLCGSDQGLAMVFQMWTKWRLNKTYLIIGTCLHTICLVPEQQKREKSWNSLRPGNSQGGRV